MYIEKYKNQKFLDFINKKIKKCRKVLTKRCCYVRINELPVQKGFEKNLKKLKKVLDKVK